MAKLTLLIVTVAPSARPLKVPVTASAPSFAMRTICCPALLVIVPVVESVALPSETVPVTLSWSYCVPAVAPLTSAERVEPLLKLTLPVLMMLGLRPGDTMPPLATVTVPATVPVPPRVPVLFTATALPDASEPFTKSVPALIAVAPV